jgi:hypothetical protein
MTHHPSTGAEAVLTLQNMLKDARERYAHLPDGRREAEGAAAHRGFLYQRAEQMAGEDSTMPNVATLQRAGVRFAMEGLTLEPMNDAADQASLQMHWRGGECSADFDRLHIDEQRMMGWAASWARQGFPSVQIPHKYAAALVATVVPEIEPIRPPWPCFLVRVPDGLISLVGIKDHQPHDVQLLLCVHMAGRWSFTAIAA